MMDIMGYMVNMMDLVNGFFEICGGFIVWLNVVRIVKDKEVKGFDWRVSGFFSSWGLWNLVFYYGVNCMLSLVGSVFLMVGNMVWLGFVWKYKD